MWSQLEPSPAHLTYIVLTIFPILYALFSIFIRNRLHLSEPPLATLFGIIVGPHGIGALVPYDLGVSDTVVHEFTRVILGVQCFSVGLELPRGYFSRSWKSVGMLLGPVMFVGWAICTAFIAWIFKIGFVPASIIAACLTPTDPVLAASVLANSQFSTRVPKRLRDLLSAESGCNDGVAFPLLYVGLSILTQSSIGGIVKKWLLITVLYQCVLGTILGLVIGHIFNVVFAFSHKRELMGHASYLAFYFLLAIFATGIAATLAVDDFLVAFNAGVAFSRGGNTPTAHNRLPIIIDLITNSAMFIFFGAMIPWGSFHTLDTITPLRLLGLMALILAFRRIPVVYLLHKIKMIPHIHTNSEALFCGHFGPMGVGALFLAMEARAQLETKTSLPLPSPPDDLPMERQRAVVLVWPIICFAVFISTAVHGLSTLAISIGGHLVRHKGERAPLIGDEREGLHGMDFDDEEDEWPRRVAATDDDEVTEDEEEREERFRGYLHGNA